MGLRPLTSRGGADRSKHWLLGPKPVLAAAFLLLACGTGCVRMTPQARTVEEITVLLRPGDYDRLAYVHGEDGVGRYATFSASSRLTSWPRPATRSFLEAERQAIEARGSELRVNRIRLKHFEGFLIRSLWLQALGVADATGIPIIGWEIYTVAGTGVRLVEEDSK